MLAFVLFIIQFQQFVRKYFKYPVVVQSSRVSNCNNQQQNILFAKTNFDLEIKHENMCLIKIFIFAQEVEWNHCASGHLQV